MPTPHLDRLADTELDKLTTEEVKLLGNELYQLTNSLIGFDYENFDDFELVLYDTDLESTDYFRWPIPALRTVREVRELAERLHAATIKP